MHRDYAERFWDALVSEIKAEMGRRDLSSRGLGRLIGKSSQYMSDRLDGGSSKTGQRVVLSVRDLAAIAHAIDVSEADLAARAQAAARNTPPNVVEGRFGPEGGAPVLGAVARAADKDTAPE